jgi:hypothetical protein
MGDRTFMSGNNTCRREKMSVIGLSPKDLYFEGIGLADVI